MKPPVSTSALAQSSSRTAIWAWSTSGAIHVTAIGTLALAGYQSLPTLWQALPVRDGHHSIELTASWESPAASAERTQLAPLTNEQEPLPAEPDDALPPSVAPRETPPSTPVDSLQTAPLEVRRVTESPTPAAASLPPADAGETQSFAASIAPAPSAPRRRAASNRDDEIPPEAIPSDSVSVAVRRNRDQELNRRSPPSSVASPPAETTDRNELSSRPAQSQPAAIRSDGAESEPLPRTLFNPPPEYPADALRDRIEGRVVVRTTLNERGRVEQVALQKSSGHASLDAAALAAVRTWRFEPLGDRTTADAVRSRTVAVPVRFKIERDVPENR